MNVSTAIVMQIVTVEGLLTHQNPAGLFTANYRQKSTEEKSHVSRD